MSDIIRTATSAAPKQVDRLIRARQRRYHILRQTRRVALRSALTAAFISNSTRE